LLRNLPQAEAKGLGLSPARPAPPVRGRQGRVAAPARVPQRPPGDDPGSPDRGRRRCRL